jgi:hypothetical protein
MTRKPPPTATKKTVAYLDELLNSGGFGTHLQKMGYVRKRVLREDFMGLGDLYQFEASQLIDQLLEQKERTGPKISYYGSEEE